MNTTQITTKKQFKTNKHDGSLICRHRDISCCKDCANAHEEIVDVFSAYFWIDDKAERDALLAMV